LCQEKQQYQNGVRIQKGKRGKYRLHPLIYTLLNFNLAQNTVGSQVKAIQKKAPTDSPATANGG
jgi:hypothetical protein